MTASTSPHPLPAALWQELQPLLHRLDAGQALWVSGYLAARGASASSAPVAATAEHSRQTSGVTVLIGYGTETGNCEALAHRLAERATERGIAVEVADLAGLRLRQLARREYLAVICATHGDGDPPEPIHDFYTALMADGAPALPQLHYAVLSLGDSSYEQFCVTGQQLDERLAELGAQRLVERRDCDVDYDEPARQWMEQLLAVLPSAEAAEPAAAPGDLAGTMSAAPAAPRVEYSRQQPLAVEVLENICLSAPDRPAAMHHLELALDVTDFDLHPGDAVGVLASNPPHLVAAVLDATRLPGEQAVTVGGEAMPLVQALREHCDLTIPSKRFLEAWAVVADSSELARQVDAEAREQREFLRSHQVLDLLTRWPGRPEGQSFIDSLRPLQPRLYDIANSLQRLEDELHLTVKHYRYPFGDREEIGIASDYLLQLQAGDRVQIYPHRNTRFRLPEDPAAPLILIAEGTGAAPYRAFLQEIAAAGLGHRCWLVFAEQQFEQDFLYQLDWQEARRQGALVQVDTVWLAEHPDRSLSHPLLAQGARFMQWLEEGAHLYLCGDKALLTACEENLQREVDRRSENASAWKQLVKDKRVHRNLY